MAKHVNILQSLKTSNYLKGNCVVLNDKIRYEYSLLANGFKLRQLLLNHLLNNSFNWSTQCGGIRDTNMGLSVKQRIEFQKSHQTIYNEKLVDMCNLVASKIMCCYRDNQFVSKNNIFNECEIKALLLVTDFFVGSENDLFRYNNLQRDRKVWWMKFSANPSRFCVEPSEFASKNDSEEICKKSKSISIQAKYTDGSVEMENIFLIPLQKLTTFTELSNISLIRSVINLDLSASALILDSIILKSDDKNCTLMLNRKLAPYQVLLINLHEKNKTVDELTVHLQHVISRSGLRLYNNFIHTNCHDDLEKNLLQSDSLGIPYALLIDNESTKSGLIRMRSRDTTLFETIHISDIPSYLINIFQH